MLQLPPAFTPQTADEAAARILGWLESPPDASLILLPPLPPPAYPALLQRMGLAT